VSYTVTDMSTAAYLRTRSEGLRINTFLVLLNVTIRTERGMMYIVQGYRQSNCTAAVTVTSQTVSVQKLYST